MLKNLFEYLIILHSGLFDSNYYLLSYSDVRHADINPLLHFIKKGWKEGKNPSESFNTNFYIDKNPDVKESGINPLFHYIRHGKKEGRVINDQQEELRGRSVVRNLHNFDKNFSPLVSIIVPNYNHQSFLEQRLKSIFDQSYNNYEVILLDDCSTDGSLEILEKFYELHKENSRLIINSQNSGNTFRQWEKGISIANGDLIWIAESDDFCDPDFLEKLVPFFIDESVMLSYAHSIFVDQNGNQSGFSYESYLSDINSDFLESSYIRTAHEEVNSALGFKNTIPNASAVVFRKPNEEFPLFNNEEWKNMKVCGDWIFYLEILKGGKVGYTNETHNYFRFHSHNASSKTHTQTLYYKEHETVASWIAESYKVDEDLLEKNYNIIKQYYKKQIKSGLFNSFSSLYDINKIKECREKRLPNILMVIFGFILGGGEILPVHLANELRKKGVVVTVLNFGYGEQNEGVRKMLHPQIPVINYNPNMHLKQIFLDYGIECVHTHHASMENLIAKTRISEELNIAHVATMHGMYEMMENNDQEILTNNKSVDHWCYIAEKNLIPFKRLGLYDPTKFTKVNNGIPEYQLKPFDREKYGISSDAFIFCLASRAMVSKGWYEAIEAIKIARKETKADLHLLLLGDGDVYEKLRIEKLPEFIHLLGFRNNVLDFFAESDAILLPSYYKGESVPLVIIESLYCGKPVIATNIGEVKNMISGDDNKKAGILLNLKDNKIIIKDLTHAMTQIVMDKNLYKEMSALSNRIKNRFQMSPIADKYLTIYKNNVKNISSKE